MGNVYNYMRISTKESSDKQSFARQSKSLDAYAKEHDIEYTKNTGNITKLNTRI